MCDYLDCCDDEHSSLQEKFLHAFIRKFSFQPWTLGVLVRGALSMQWLKPSKEFHSLIANAESLDVEIEKKASWTRVTNVMKKLVTEQEVWDKSLRAMAAQKLTAQANEWLADNDQTDRDPEKDPITKDEFARRILLTEFTVSPGGRFTAWYEDDDMFWGHVITVDGTLKKGPVDADIQG